MDDRFRDMRTTAWGREPDGMRKIFLFLTAIGTVIAGVATYLQAFSMDLTRYSLWQYLEADIALPDWRANVMYPLLFGLAYIVIGIVCLYRCPSRRVAFIVICTSLLLAVVLRFLSLFGIFALFCLAVVMMLFLAEQRTKKALIAATLVGVVVGIYCVLTGADFFGISLMILVAAFLLEIRKKRVGG